MLVKSYSEKDLNHVAQELIEQHSDHKIFAFYADMGVGKTTLINTICRYLKIKENTSSPTFSLVNEYESDTGDTIYHMDFYRLDDPQEAIDIGIDYYFDSDSYIFIEWPSKIEKLLPDGIVKVFINLVDENLRTLRTEIE